MAVTTLRVKEFCIVQITVVYNLYKYKDLAYLDCILVYLSLPAYLTFRSIGLSC